MELGDPGWIQSRIGGWQAVDQIVLVFQCMTSPAGEIGFMVGSHGFKSRKRKQNPHASTSQS